MAKKGGLQGDVDPNYDEKPGSEENSADYDRVYNRLGLNEATNLLEEANENELAFQLRDREKRQAERYREQMLAQSRVQFFGGVGKFIIPRENTWAAHFRQVGHEHTELHFDPVTYPLFDKIIAEKSGLAALTDPNHPEYASYEGLRDNLAVLRNFIFTDTFHDGSFDPGDERFVPRIIAIAEEIGSGLKHDNWLSRILLPAINLNVAKIEGEGAAEIYQHLLSRQQKRSLLTDLIAPLMSLTGQPVRHWNLPSLEETPFSEEGLNALPPQFHQTRAEAITQQHAQANEPVKSQGTSQAQASGPAQDAMALAGTLNTMATAIQGHARKFRNVDEMSDESLDESVELGREILRRLRNMQFTDQSVENLLDQAAPQGETPAAAAAADALTQSRSPSGSMQAQKIQDVRSQKIVKQAQKVAQIIEIYSQYLDQARQFDPNIVENQRVRQANAAIEEYVHSIKLMAAMEIPNSIAAAQQIGAQATLDPAHWDDLHQKATDRLLTSIEGGMEDALDALDQQEMDQDRQNDELAEAAIESALMHSDQSRRRKRRKRKQQTRSGKSQLKKHLDLTADDFVLKQGRFREDKSGPHGQSVPAQPRSGQATDPIPPGLKLDDLDAVRQVGESLKKATDTGKELEDALRTTLAAQQAHQQQDQINNPLNPLSATQQLSNERDRRSNRRTGPQGSGGM